MVIYFNFLSAKTWQNSKLATSLTAATPLLSKSLWAYIANKEGQCDFHSLVDLLTAPWNDEGVALPVP